MAYTPTVTGQKVASFLGQPNDQDLIALANIHIEIVRDMVRAYTRDQGFVWTDSTQNSYPKTWVLEPNSELAAVIVMATARSVINPEQRRREGLGSYYVAPQPFVGFTMAETMTLNRYRKTAA
jgi:hypothetical protein